MDKKEWESLAVLQWDFCGNIRFRWGNWELELSSKSVYVKYIEDECYRDTLKIPLDCDNENAAIMFFRHMQKTMYCNWFKGWKELYKWMKTYGAKRLIAEYIGV